MRPYRVAIRACTPRDLPPRFKPLLPRPPTAAFRANDPHLKPTATARAESADGRTGRVRGLGKHPEFRRERLDERKVPPRLTQEPQSSFPLRGLTLRISCEAVPPSIPPAGAQGGTSACRTGAALSFVSCIRLFDAAAHSLLGVISIFDRNVRMRIAEGCER